MISIYSIPGSNVKAVRYQSIICNDFKTLVKFALQYQWSPITWQDNYRKRENFKSCEFCVLDIDGGLSYPQAVRIITERKIKAVILSTENHQREKDGKICDRMRIIMRWDKPITDLETYLFNYRAWNREFSGDRATAEGGRHFKPSPMMLGAFDGELLAVSKPMIKPKIDKDEFFKAIDFKKSGRLPQDLLDFIERGNLLTTGRQNSFFLAACTCRKLGIPKTEALALLKRAPVNTNNFDFDSEFYHAVNSAYGYK